MQLDEPAECVSGGDQLLLYKILHLLFFPLVQILCALCLKSWKNINMVSMWNLWNFRFFGQADVSPTNSEICHFVLGSYAKHQVSSPVIILFKKFLCASAFTIMSEQDVTRSSLCSVVEECGTKHAHNFLFPKSSFRIWRRDFQRFWYHSWCDSTVILTKSATAAIFISVRVNFRRPPLSSSSTSSLPSWNREYNLRTFDRFRTSFS